jgi:hypothetical protein
VSDGTSDVIIEICIAVDHSPARVRAWAAIWRRLLAPDTDGSTDADANGVSNGG